MRNKKMGDISFKMMSKIFKIMDLFQIVDKKLDKFDIKKGDIVIDYGCGPGRYIKKCSNLVSESGKVFAVDIHPLAIETVQKLSKKEGLNNVETYIVKDDKTEIKDNIVDKIYALDMFHHVGDPEPFFKELYRVIKKDGTLYIEDGHQSRKSSIKKISKSPHWDIKKEEKSYLVLKPKQ